MAGRRKIGLFPRDGFQGVFAEVGRIPIRPITNAGHAGNGGPLLRAYRHRGGTIEWGAAGGQDAREAGGEQKSDAAEMHDVAHDDPHHPTFSR